MAKKEIDVLPAGDIVVCEEGIFNVNPLPFGDNGIMITAIGNGVGVISLSYENLIEVIELLTNIKEDYDKFR